MPGYGAALAAVQGLQRLVLDGLFLLCSTWDQPPPVIFIENVPRITSRGRELLDQARQLLTAHGYAVTPDDFHDCGEIGGLAQHRRRFFMVARCRRRVPQLIYCPPKLRVRACGEVLGALPTPGDEDAGGPMHRLPRISWLNWVRLALIPAGGDWRDLPGVVPDGKQRREVHRRHAVAPWTEPVRTVVGPGGASAENVADPRLGLGQTAKGAGSYKGRPGLFGVQDWARPAATVTSSASVSGSNAPAAVADPRLGLSDNPGRHHNKYKVTGWDAPAQTVIGATRPGSGAAAAADPRFALPESRGRHSNQYRVMGWEESAGTVTGAARGVGAPSVADPRLGCRPRSGAYGVLRWEDAAATITGSLRVDNGRAAIADPRIPEDPKRPPEFIPVIVAADGTWHRPLTTLELAVLQSLPATVKGEPLRLEGRSVTAWRERIGNMIPPAAGQAIASEMLLALLASKLGTMRLSSEAVWVEPVEVVAS